MRVLPCWQGAGEARHLGEGARKRVAAARNPAAAARNCVVAAAHNPAEVEAAHRSAEVAEGEGAAPSATGWVAAVADNTGSPRQAADLRQPLLLRRRAPRNTDNRSSRAAHRGRIVGRSS